MSTPLADPKLSAFFNADPSVLHVPDPLDGQTAVLPAQPYTPAKKDLPAIELAAAFLVVIGLVARHLAHSKPDPQPQRAAKTAWQRYAPLWLRLAVPAISHAYKQGRVTGLTAAELAVMATDYATNLGDYISDSSADALADGFGQQLNAKWSEQVAWQRAAAGYGLDGAAMHAHIAGLMRGGEAGQTDIMPTLARTFVDKLLIRRADRLGQTETWRAQQSGKVISWLYLQRAGRLPVDARKVWRTREDESTCPVCAPLDEVEVPLDEPWVTIEGVRLWAPSAHPGCRCEAELVDPPEAVAKARGADPWNRNRDGEFAETEQRGPKAAAAKQQRGPKVAERTRSVDADIVEQLRRNVAPEAPADPFTSTSDDPFKSLDPFAGKSDPFASDPFAGGGGGGGAKTADPFSADPFAEEAAAAAGKGKRRRTRRFTRNRILLGVTRKEDGPGSRSEPFYMPADEFLNTWETSEYEYRFDPGEVIDFDEMREALVYNGDSQEGDPFAVAAARVKNLQQTFDPEDMWELDQHQWDKALPVMRDVYASALLQADTIVDDLTSNDLQAIALDAGYETREGSDALRERILRAVRDSDDGTGLAAAYADRVLWHYPATVGADGEEFARMVEEWERQIYVYDTPRQNLIFENGFHPGTLYDTNRYGLNLASLHGKYVITHVGYNSNIGSGYSNPAKGAVGWRSLYLSPIDDEQLEAMGEPPDAGQAPDYDEAMRRMRNGGVT